MSLRDEVVAQIGFDPDWITALARAHRLIADVAHELERKGEDGLASALDHAIADVWGTKVQLQQAHQDSRHRP